MVDWFAFFRRYESVPIVWKEIRTTWRPKAPCQLRLQNVLVIRPQKAKNTLLDVVLIRQQNKAQRSGPVISALTLPYSQDARSLSVTVLEAQTQ